MKKQLNPTEVLEYFTGCCVNTDENNIVRNMCSRKILTLILLTWRIR
jgi:hypothetical protein